MKIYKVKICTVDHCCEVGKLIDPYTALVKANFFGFVVREAFTNTLIKRCCPDETINNLFYLGYNRHGVVLGFDKEELNDNNLATEEDLDKYIRKFKNSKIKRKIEKYKNIDMDKVKLESEKVRNKIKTNRGDN